MLYHVFNFRYSKPDLGGRSLRLFDFGVRYSASIFDICVLPSLDLTERVLFLFSLPHTHTLITPSFFSPFLVVINQRDFLSKTLATLPVVILKDLAQRMVLVRKDSDPEIDDTAKGITLLSIHCLVFDNIAL